MGQRLTHLLMYCFKRTANLDHDGEVEIAMHPAYPSKTQDPALFAEATRFFKSTPSGQFTFTVKNRDIGDMFKSGKNYRLILEEYEPEVPSSTAG